MELNSLVWFNGGESYPLPGRIVEINEGTVKVLSIISNKTHVIEDPTADLRRRHDAIEIKTIDDLIVLRDLHEGSIVHNLRERYNKGLIYTYTGSILIAINPYQLLDIYGLDTVNKYHGQPLGLLPPHLFAIGSAAYERLVNQAVDQCLIISGESGAGKTESTKLVMQYLAVVNKGSSSTHITEQILEANPLLESFGNAKTVKNDNSSRFGKFIEVFFNSGTITGARTTHYLLEKSRIVYQAKGERNYHIFYEMLAGMSQAERAKYGLVAASSYNYLNQGGNPRNDLRDDAEEFQRLDRSLDVINFKPLEKKTIFSILAAVLHLGNVEFKMEGDSSRSLSIEKLEIANHQQVDWAAKLLNLSSVDLEKALIYKVTETAGEKILTLRTVEQAVNARDGLTKSLYTSLFEWLVSKINSTTVKDIKLNYIAILDIYGFEVFTHNSFEQLCINHANEYLQFFFNRHIFQLEQMEYQKEKIPWTDIQFNNNQLCLDLMAKRPTGIFHLLDDESNFPQGSDKSFLDKCHYHHTGQRHYSYPKTTPMCFAVMHYAGKVTYDVSKFVEKNRDILKQDVISMFQGSGSEIISGMFHSLQDKEQRRSSIYPSNRFGPRKMRASTVATKFCESLDDLLFSMSKCNPFFVRCIKPNTTKSALTFEVESVIEQLRYSGMLETVRIRKAGYPIRLTFKKFAERYRFLVGAISFRNSPKSVVQSILGKIDPSMTSEYKIGITKNKVESLQYFCESGSYPQQVFLKEHFENYLERLRTNIIIKAVLVIQKYVKGYIAYRRYQRLRQNIIGLQARIRGMMVRKRTRAALTGLVFIQARTRGFIQRRRYAKMLERHRRELEIERKRQEELARQREEEAARNARKSVMISDVIQLKNELDNGAILEPAQPPTTVDAVSLNHLEIPHPLHVLLQDAEDRRLQYNEKQHVVKVPGSTPEMKTITSLPTNIEDFPFSKYISIHFKNETFGYQAVPLTTSLHKLGPEDEQAAVTINKLLLRFTHIRDQPTNALPEDKVFIVGSYIIQQCISNRNLRDEVYCQLCSLSWGCPSKECSNRVWLLMSNLLSVCPPSTNLKNYLLKFISDHAFEGYKAYCQHKLLTMDSHAFEFEESRAYPPTLLEWKAHQLMGRMTVATWFNDRKLLNQEVHSWVTGNDFAKALLLQRGVVTDNNGWSISMLEGGVRCELAGSEYVLDLVSEVELPPNMEAGNPGFIVASENVSEMKSRRNPAVAGGGAVNGFGELFSKTTYGANPSLLNSRGPSGGPTDGSIYPAMYPKPDYAIEKYQADRLRKRDAVGEPIYAEVKKKRPSSYLPPVDYDEMSNPQRDADFVGDLFKDIIAMDDGIGLDDSYAVDQALRGGGDTPAGPTLNQTAPGQPVYNPMGAIPQPIYTTYQPPPMMYQQPSFIPIQQQIPGVVPMIQPQPQPQPAPQGADSLQQALMAQQLQMQSMQTQQMVQNLQQQMAALQNTEKSQEKTEYQTIQELQKEIKELKERDRASSAPRPRWQEQQQKPDVHLHTIRKMEKEIEELKKQTRSSSRPKSALKWSDPEQSSNRRSIQFEEKVEVIPRGEEDNEIERPRPSALKNRRKTPVALPSLSDDLEENGLTPASIDAMLNQQPVDIFSDSAPPPPPPPPLPPSLFQSEPEPMKLRNKKGQLIVFKQDKENRAKTIRVGKVVWPPRQEEVEKQEVVPGREIGNASKSVKSVSIGKFEINAEDLAERSRSLKPTKTRERPKKVGQVTDKPAVVVPRKKAPPPPPPVKHAIQPTKQTPKQQVKKADQHAEALKLLMAQNAFPQTPPKPVKTVTKKLQLPDPPPPPPQAPPAPLPQAPSPPSTKRPISILMRRQEPAAPPLPPRQEGMQKKVKKSSAVQRAQEMLEQKKQVVSVQPEVAPAHAVAMVTAAQVIKLKDYENVQTRLYKKTQGDYYGYHRVPWTIQVRKEVFIPGEIVQNDLIRELIFRQIVVDVYSNSCIRMTKAEKRMMKSLLQERDISELNIGARITYAPKVIEKAQQLSFYFCRFFPVISGSKNLVVDYIGVSHHSIVLVQRSTDPMQDQLRTIEAFEFSELRAVKATMHGNLRIVTKSDSIIPLYTRRAVQLKNMIDGYITFLQEDSQYVRAIRDYSANESTLLSFQKGDVIKVTEHEVIRENKDWLFGVLNGKTGFFPSQLVEQISGQSSKPAPTQPPMKSKDKMDMPGRLSMEEFAMKHFRDVPDRPTLRKQRGFIGSVKQSLKKSKSRKKSIDSNLLIEYKGMVTFENSPIHVSLLPLEPEENNIAKECFVALMQIMGDYPLQKRSVDEEEERVYYRNFNKILKTVKEHENLADEIYCHAVKQTTNDASNHSKSCANGWRVLYLLSMFAKCSDNLKPYLFHHLEDCSSAEAENKYSAMANSSLLNLKKTFKHGIRKKLPSRDETSKILEGRLYKQQPFLIPESTQRSVRVKGNTLVDDAIRMICEDMNLVHDEDILEFGILSVIAHNKEQKKKLLDRETYILDAIPDKGGVTLIFLRVVWRRQLKVEKDLLLSLLFHQVKQDYLQSQLILLTEEGLTETLKEMIAYLGALLLRVMQLNQVPSMRDLQHLVPTMVLTDEIVFPNSQRVAPQQWLNLIEEKGADNVSKLSPAKAMMHFLHLMQKAKLYGSSFFNIKSSSNQLINIPGCVMAVNKSGIYFLDSKRHALIHSYDLSEVISATPFTTYEGQQVLKINIGTLQTMKGEHFELDKTEQASNLIQLYLRDIHGKPRVAELQMPDEHIPSMEERRAAVEQVISKPPTKKLSAPEVPSNIVQHGIRQPTILAEYATSINMMHLRDEQKKNTSPPSKPLQPLLEEPNQVPQLQAPDNRPVDQVPEIGRNIQPKRRAPPPTSSNILARGHSRKGGSKF